MADDHEANVSKAVSMVGEASKRGASVVCLPELFPYRYFPQERGVKVRPEPIPGPTTRRLSEAARDSKVALVGGSLYERASGGRLYNTSVVFDERGRMLGKYRKVQVPQDEGFYEKDYFSERERLPRLQDLRGEDRGPRLLRPVVPGGGEGEQADGGRGPLLSNGDRDRGRD